MRIVFTDLDDTLLARDKSVPNQVVDALGELARRGIPFVPCTGRPLRGLPALVAALPGLSHVIASDGATVYEVKLDARSRTALQERAARDVRSYAGDELWSCARQIHAEPLGAQKTLELYERVRAMDVTVDVFIEGRAMAERRRWERIRCIGVDPELERLIRTMRTPYDGDATTLLAGNSAEVERVTVMWWHPGDRERVLAAVDELGLRAVSSGRHNLEITARDTTKGSAVRWLCAHLGIDTADAVAFGDSGNDLAMLEAVGDGVAMANASDDVRSVATHVTEQDCDAGGEGSYLLAALGLR